VDLEPPAQRRHPVGEAAQPRALRGQHASHAVVGDLEHEAPAPDAGLDAHVARAGVLRDVRQRLGHREVRGGLHGLGQPLGGRAHDLDGHGRAGGEVLDRGGQALMGEDRGAQPACEVAQLADRLARVRVGLSDERERVLAPCEPALGHPERERHGNEALLRDARLGVLERAHARGELRAGRGGEEEPGDPRVEQGERAHDREGEDGGEHPERHDGDPARGVSAHRTSGWEPAIAAHSGAVSSAKVIEAAVKVTAKATRPSGKASRRYATSR